MIPRLSISDGRLRTIANVSNALGDGAKMTGQQSSMHSRSHGEELGCLANVEFKSKELLAFSS